MKIEKKELEEISVEAIGIGLTALALLALSGCPHSALYATVEKFIERIDKLRESLELKPMVPPEIKEGLISKAMRAMEAKQPPLDTSEMN